jgi:hypothetical protein
VLAFLWFRGLLLLIVAGRVDFFLWLGGLISLVARRVDYLVTERASFYCI